MKHKNFIKLSGLSFASLFSMVGIMIFFSCSNNNMNMENNMNKKEKIKIMKQLDLPHYFIKKDNLAYYITSKLGLDVVTGIYIDSSIDPENFFVQYFVQPLYIRFPTFIFNFGYRIGSHWTIKDLEKINLELSILNKFNDFNDFTIVQF